MKRKSLLVMLLFLGFISLRGQPGGDDSDVLQTCVDLPELQAYFEDAGGTTLEQLTIMDCCGEFTNATAVRKFGKPLQILDKKELESVDPGTYVQFYIYEVGSEKARVDYTLFRKGASPDKVWVYLELEQQEGNWTIVTKKIEER